MSCVERGGDGAVEPRSVETPGRVGRDERLDVLRYLSRLRVDRVDRLIETNSVLRPIIDTNRAISDSFFPAAVISREVDRVVVLRRGR